MKLRRAILFIFMAALVLGQVAAQAKYASPAVTAEEKAMAAEKRPDFSSPPIEDKALKVAGLPEALKWYTSKTNAWGSARAKQGGTYHSYIPEFPATFRTVGPNANGSSRPLFLTTPGCVELNSETREFLPAMATHWAFGADKKTVYFKLNEKATWSDGKPVTSKDYVFMLKMMRDEDIQDPWYNETYTTQFIDVKAYGDWCVAVTMNVEMPQADLLLNASIAPRPQHFYGGEIGKDWVDEYQWKAEPTAGPYALDSFEKGEVLVFKKMKNWWGHEYGYNKGRFNIDSIEYKIITGGNDVLKNYFYKGELDQFYQIIPTLWADESKAEAFQKGYIDRHYTYYVPQQGVAGIFLNTKAPVFSDVNVRKGLYYAINIQKMIDTVLRGEYARFHNIGIGHVFSGIDFDDNTIRKPGFDPAKAAELFAKGGYDKVGPDGIRVNASGARLTFELIYQSPNHTERISVLKEEAKKCGLDITLNLMQKGAFTAMREKKFEAFWGGMGTGMYDDYWEFFHSKNAIEPQTNNFWGYANPQMDAWLDEFRDSGDLKRKAELSKLVQRKVDEEALVIPYYYVPYNRGATWKWVRYPGWISTKYFDYFPSPDLYQANIGYGDYIGFMWIDEKIRTEVLAAQKAGKAYEPRTFIAELYKSK
jgi:microcin C transport system substrate-binding protein